MEIQIYLYLKKTLLCLKHNQEKLHFLNQIFHLISLNKWYVDEIYEKIFTKQVFILGSFFWNRGDQKSIDAYGPDGISKLIKLSSKIFSRFQSGFLYHYVFVMLIGLVIILSWFVYY